MIKQSFRLASFAALSSIALIVATPAHALNILLCNDDGITAANVRALKQRLAAEGHNVIVTAPADNQSGRGGYVAFLQPVPKLTGNERASKDLGLAAGTPGVGVDPSDPDVHFVNGTPVAACLYGIDVKAMATWGRAPDLVISGPNEGNNTGHINASSGTFNNLLYAINRGLPAIAFSDFDTRQIKWSASLPAASRPFEVADIVIRVLDQVLQVKSPRTHGKRLSFERVLPEGLGLNVNIPDFQPGNGTALRLAVTDIGVATAFAPAFYERLSDSALAAGLGLNFPVPGVSLAPGGTVLPTGVVLPNDTSRSSEGNAIARGVITVSPVQGMPEAHQRFVGWLRGRLSGEHEGR